MSLRTIRPLPPYGHQRGCSFKASLLRSGSSVHTLYSRCLYTHQCWGNTASSIKEGESGCQHARPHTCELLVDQHDVPAVFLLLALPLLWCQRWLPLYVESDKWFYYSPRQPLCIMSVHWGVWFERPPSQASQSREHYYFFFFFFPFLFIISQPFRKPLPIPHPEVCEPLLYYISWPTNLFPAPDVELLQITQARLARQLSDAAVRSIRSCSVIITCPIVRGRMRQ